MPSNTVNGLPYPLPTEPVRDGAMGVRYLAEAADKADTVALAMATLVSAGISTGRTGWGLNTNSADPSGRAIIGANGISVAKTTIVFVQFQPAISSPGSVTFGIALNNPSSGAVYAQTVYTTGGPGTRISGMWVLGAGSSLHPVFLSAASGSSCTGGSFEMCAFNNRATA